MKTDLHARMIRIVGSSLLALFIGCSALEERGETSGAVSDNVRTDVSQYVIDKLSSYRVVMIGDSEHGQGIYGQTVVACLHHWIDGAEKANVALPVVPSKLSLVIECDSVQVANLHRFFQSGDICDAMTLGSFIAPHYSTSIIEFYQDLSGILDRVKEHNLAYPERRLSLKLVGPEKPLDYFGWTDDKRRHFYLYERDEYAADWLIRYMEQNPDHKALVFCGSAHLARGLRRKKAEHPDSLGHYLAHYIQEHYGEDSGLFTIHQWVIEPNLTLPAEFKSPGVTYAIDGTVISDLQEFSRDYRLTGDGVIIHLTRPEVFRPISWVKSERLIRSAVDSLSGLRKPVDSSYPREAHMLCTYLVKTTGHSVSELWKHDNWQDVLVAARVWRERLERNSYDLVNSIHSLSLWKRLADSLAIADGIMIRVYEGTLARSLGILPRRDTLSSPVARADYYRQRISDDSAYIVMENLVHLLWAGSETEKAEAVRILQEMTGESYDRPKQWMNYWRRRNGWMQQ